METWAPQIKDRIRAARDSWSHGDGGQTVKWAVETLLAGEGYQQVCPSKEKIIPMSATNHYRNAVTRCSRCGTLERRLSKNCRA